MISGPMPSPRITAMVWVICCCSRASGCCRKGPVLCPSPSSRCRFGRREGTDLQGVDVGVHHLPERGIDQPMTRQRRQPGEGGAGDVDGKMPAPVARAFVADVLVAVVTNLQRL